MGFDIAIIGGGIAGFASAIALSRDGHRVTVYERRLDTAELSGSGVQVQPSGIHILSRWGLMDELKKVAHQSEYVKIIRYESGKIIASQYRQGERGYGIPSCRP